MPLSKDPAKRERQLANLRPNWPSSRSAERSAERSGDERPPAPERSPEKRPSGGRKRRVVTHAPAAAAEPAKPEPPTSKEPADGGTDHREPERRRGGFFDGLLGRY